MFVLYTLFVATLYGVHGVSASALNNINKPTCCRASFWVNLACLMGVHLATAFFYTR